MKTVNRFGPHEQHVQGSIPDSLKCFCGGNMVRRTRSDLDGTHDVICWPHHICGNCGVIVRFTKGGYRAYMHALNPVVPTEEEVVAALVEPVDDVPENPEAAAVAE
jgi:hypothetical protein